jgi:hypothetical protein
MVELAPANDVEALKTRCHVEISLSTQIEGVGIGRELPLAGIEPSH